MENYKQIIDNCRLQKRDAQAHFFAYFHRRIYNTCFRILESHPDAEEVVQEAFLKVLMQMELLRDDPRVMESLLRRIAINMSIDVCRRKKYRNVEIDVNQLEDTGHASDELLQFDSDIDVEMIKHKMQQLPPSFRLVLSLKLLDDLEYDEIAEQLGITQHTARAHFSKARRQLTQLIKMEL